MQCFNLKRLAGARALSAEKLPRRPARDFIFGRARISPEERNLSALHPANGAGPRVVPLTELQVKLLEILHASPGKILRYEFLCHTVWHRAFMGKTGAIREAISSLRRKFKTGGVDFDRWVKSVYGTGIRYSRR